MFSVRWDHGCRFVTCFSALLGKVQVHTMVQVVSNKGELRLLVVTTDKLPVKPSRFGSVTQTELLQKRCSDSVQNLGPSKLDMAHHCCTC